MAEIVCPHCKGTSVNYVIAMQDGKPSIQPVKCVVCDGKGHVPAPDPDPVASPPLVPEIWPILLPLGIFFSFFIFLWM